MWMGNQMIVVCFKTNDSSCLTWIVMFIEQYSKVFTVIVYFAKYTSNCIGIQKDYRSSKYFKRIIEYKAEIQYFNKVFENLKIINVLAMYLNLNLFITRDFFV